MDIFAEIKQILIAILNLEDEAVTPESYLLRELGAESVDLLELAAALQVRFKIEVDEALLFLPGVWGGEPPRGTIPHLTDERLGEIAADPSGGPVLKVKDLVSYVQWKLKQ